MAWKIKKIAPAQIEQARPTSAALRRPRHPSLPAPPVDNSPRDEAGQKLARPVWQRMDPHAYVMGCFKRPGLVLPYLATQSHTLYIGEDYEMTPDIIPMKEIYAAGSPLLSNYRVFKGHQEMMKMFLQTKEPMALFFEDDAVPNTPYWVNIVNEAANSAPKDIEVLALYGRSFEYSRFEVDYRIDNGRREVLRLNDPQATESMRGGKHHVYGTLAYLVTRKGAEKIVKLKWEGIPCDVVFWDRTEFAFLNPSPFNHDRCQGSILFPESCPDRRPSELKEKPLEFDAPRND